MADRDSRGGRRERGGVLDGRRWPAIRLETRDRRGSLRPVGALSMHTGAATMKETKGKPKKAAAPKPNASQPSTKGLPASPAKGK